jgi:hypothetical protein
MMLKNAFSKRFDGFWSDATSQIPQSEQRIAKDIKSETLMSRKKLPERKLRIMWRLKWKKCWIEKIFSEKDEFGHCKRIHRINHEKDVIGDVVFKDYDRAMYLADSMSELTKIRHVVIPE